MKTIFSILFIAVIGNTAYAQDPDAGESTQYVQVASSNPEAVVLDGTDFFESEPLGTLLQNQQVTMLDSTDGEYVKIRAVIDGKKVEGWVKKIILKPKPIEYTNEVTESGGVSNASMAAPGTVSPGIIEPPWDQIDLTGKEMKPFYVPIVPVKSSSPLVPILIGVVGVGTLTYIILQDDTNPEDCSFTASAQASPSSCSLPNGNIVVTVNSTAELAFVWSTGSTTKDLLEVAAGNYTVTITRTGTTCTQVLSATVNNVDQPITTDITTQDADCGMQNGSVTISVSPPAFYTYAWSNGPTTQNQTQLAPGVYGLTVSSTGTCMESYSVTINELPPSFEITLQSTPSNCGLTDGTATATVDPPGEYLYAWSNVQSGPIASNLSSGSYTVTVSIPGTNCSKEANINVEELPAAFTLTVSSTPSGCGLSDGTATVTADPPGTYTYAWSSGHSGSQASGLVAGSYNVTVSITGTNCSKETNVTIEELPAAFNVTISSTPASCGVADGTATVTADPPGAYSFQWSTGETTAQATGLVAGSYNVTVSITGTTCTQQASVNVEELPAGFTVTISSTPSACGMSDGTATALVDPPGEYLFAWSTGQNMAQASGLAPGVYTVTVTITGSSCSQESSITVEELPPAFILTFTTTPAGCGLNNGSATVNVDPAGAYMYQWSTGPTDPQISNVAAGQYSVTVTAAGTMCSNNATVTVEQAGGGFTATFTTDNAECGLSNGSATITPDPPAEYTFVWSDQQTGPMLQNAAAGTYSVTVTDANSCSEEFSVTVSQDPAEYITINTTTPGNCTGGGDINFTVSTPGSGPLDVQITGPEGTTTITVAPGVYNLSAFLTILPGAYTIVVTDQQIGPSCSETTETTVQDNTPPLTVTDDFYNTTGTQPVEENALNNDSGLGIQMTMVSNEVGGTVTFSASGDFEFIAEVGFNGDASFTYTVTDTCGNTSTGIVTIFVEVVVCEFEVEFETTNASCGLDDGIITVDVIEPGSYEYLWNTGDSGPTIQNIFAGTYTVTITDLNLGCDLAFTLSLAEDPADYIEDVTVIQPTCSSPGDIQFTAFTSSQNDLIMTVTHPNGTDVFTIDPDLIRLSDYINITPGDYTIEVSDSGAGPDCFESFDVTLNQPPMLQIVEEAVFPPTEPTGMDGFAVIVVTVPGVFPYTVLLNGLPYSTANNNTIQVLGLGVGEYDIQIIDAAGCMSNILTINVPLPDIILSFGTGITNSSIEDASYESATLSPSSQWKSGWLATMQYHLAGVPQEIRFLYVPPSSHRNINPWRSFIEVQYLTGIKNVKWKNLRMVIQGGIDIQYVASVSPDAMLLPHFWMLKASTGYRFKNLVNVQGSFSLRGWEKIERPVMDVSITLPLTGYSIRPVIGTQ